MDHQRLRPVFWIVSILICLVSAALSCLLGLLASVLYDGSLTRRKPPPRHTVIAPTPEETPTDNRVVDLGLVGGIAGGMSGLLAGVAWARIMHWWTLRMLGASGRVSPWTIGVSIVAGIGVGLLATIVLHGVLYAFSSHTNTATVASNLPGVLAIFTLPAGGILGLFGGLIWYVPCVLIHHRWRATAVEATTTNQLPRA